MLRVKDWNEFQHYKDRSPPWIKLHRTLLDNFEWHKLQDASKSLAMYLWLIASENPDPSSGIITEPVEKIAFRIRWDEKKVLEGIKDLIRKGFFEEIEEARDLLSDRYHDATPETESEGETDKADKGGFSKRFIEFWSLFPNQRKGNRNKALSAYVAAVKQKRATEEEIHAGLRRYIESAEVKAGFAKGAAAWLNDDRWNSDFSRGNAATGGGGSRSPGKSQRARDVLIRSAEDVDAVFDAGPGRAPETD